MACRFCLFTTAGIVLLILTASPTRAARVRYHYVPDDGPEGLPMRLSGLGESAGERVSWFGLVRQPFAYPPRPSRFVAFNHPASRRVVIVPLALPNDTPRMEYRNRWVIYNYGTDTVQIHFLPDGSVDVYYTNSFRRP